MKGLPVEVKATGLDGMSRKISRINKNVNNLKAKLAALRASLLRVKRMNSGLR